MFTAIIRESHCCEIVSEQFFTTREAAQDYINYWASKAVPPVKWACPVPEVFNSVDENGEDDFGYHAEICEPKVFDSLDAWVEQQQAVKS